MDNSSVTSLDAQHSVDVALGRLLTIVWSQEIDYSNRAKTEMEIRLIHEYLRRLAFWYSALAQKGDSMKYYDAAEAIAPLPEFARAKMETVWEHHTDQLARKRDEPSYYQDKLCRQYVHWVAVQHLIPTHLASLLPPYNPIILLYEHGGDFHFSNVGDIKLYTGTSFGYRSVEEYLALPKILELDDALLDDIDKMESVNQG